MALVLVTGAALRPKCLNPAGRLAAELILDGEITPLTPADVSLARFSGLIQEFEPTGSSSLDRQSLACARGNVA